MNWRAFSFAVILYVAIPFAQAFATFHVRPPRAALMHPIPKETEWTRGEAAAWVQAIGTLFIFAGAIYFSRRDHQRSTNLFEEERGREESIRHLRAHSLAHALYPDLIEVRAKIGRSEAAITQQRTPGNYLGPLQEKTRDWAIDIPNGFQTTGEIFYLLGTDTAPVVSQLLSLLHQHNRVVDQLIKEMSNKKTFSHAWAVFTNKELFANRFRLMKEDIEEALDLVGKIRDKGLLPEYTLVSQGRPKR